MKKELEILKHIGLLIVEDDKEIRETLSLNLEKNFAKIFLAGDGIEALELFKIHRPKVILTDLSMPKMDGMQLASAIRKLDHTVYISAITATNEEQVLLQAIRIGFDDFLIKPISHQTLKQFIINAAEKIALHRRLKRQQEELEEAYALADICSFRSLKGDMSAPLEADRFLDMMFGCNHDTMSTYDFFKKHICPNELEEFLKQHEQFLKQKETHQQFEIGMQKADGTPLEVVIKCKKELDEDGRIHHIHAIIKNITPIKQSERQALKRENEFSLLLDTIPDGAWSWNLKENSLYLSPQWKKMLGYEDHDLPNIIDTFYDILHPDDQEKVQREIDRHLKRKSHIYESRFRLRCKDGTYKWIKARGRAIFNSEGKAHKMLGLNEDLGDEIRAANAEKEVAVYEKIVSSTQDMLAFIDSERKHKAVNIAYAKKFGLEISEILGKQPLEIMGEELYEKIAHERLDRCYRGETVEFYEWINFFQEERFYKVTYIPYWLSNSSQIEGVVVNAHDLTEWKHTEEQLIHFTNTLETKVDEKVEELREKDGILIQQGRFAAMGEMLSMIAHQWRQPLNAVSAAAINMKLFSEMGELSIENVEKQCSFIENQTQQMSQTINDFMSFFRPDREKAEFSLHACIDKVITIISAQLKTRSITLKVNIPPDVKLIGIKNEMEHILLNLISNARDAIDEQKPAKKIIKIEAFNRENRVIVTVSDTGGGVPKEFLGKIFDPYFTTKAQNKGSGIGLYMAKTIIEQHFDGTINVFNREDGAEFVMEFLRY